MPGAMPWHHRYIGNPILSALARYVSKVSCGDFHCGLRGFKKAKVENINICCDGMEFATKMILRAAVAQLAISQIPVVLYQDKRGRRPHLRSFRDGLRHIAVICKHVLKKA